MQAREIMTDNPTCCTPSDSLQAAARMMMDSNVGLLPVVESRDNPRLVGVISDRDIVCRVVAQGKDCTSTRVQEAMSSGRLWTAMPNTMIDEVLDRMEEGQVRRIPVVDDNGLVQGIISTADIALEIDEPEEIAEVFEQISEPADMA